MAANGQAQYGAEFILECEARGLVMIWWLIPDAPSSEECR